MDYKVYILFSKQLGKYYIGYTSDLEDRLYKHNNQHKGFTASANDWQVVYAETFTKKQEALEREKAIKRKKSRKYIEYLINNQ